MRTFIVRQPILDVNQDVIGYEILYKEKITSRNEKMSDGVAANAIENILIEFNKETFLDNKMAFLTFTPNLLLKDIPRIFDSSSLVIQIDDDTIVNPVAQKKVYEYKEKGYSIAINSFNFALRYFSILDVVDIIKINFSRINDTIRNVVSIGKKFNKEIIAYNINTKEAYDLAVELECTYLQGSFVAKKLPTTSNTVNHLKSNFYELMVEVNSDEPNIKEIEKIISRDVSLTYSLLKLVNSAYFALKNRAKSVNQALVVLGIGQLKQWIYLLSFRQDNGEMPSELIKISFLRANFCQELAKEINNPEISLSEAYLVGMFSTLGSLLNISLDEALGYIPVSDELKEALLNKEGILGQLLDLVVLYENADWNNMINYAKILDVSVNNLTKTYFDCVEYVNNIWNNLLESNY